MKKTTTFFLLFLIFSSSCFAQAGEWTWMKGSSTPNSSGTFGVKGISSPTNNPPALYAAALWLDGSNNIWLFGGVVFNTLWKYSIADNEWTWINGTTINSSPGVYGTMGVPSPTNTPGARGYGFLSWKDLNGDFWIYGGDGYDANGNEGLLNDVWRYSMATNEWTWMSGTNTALPSASPDYGTLQVPSLTNTPGGREETTFNWVDGDGNLWFYGGFDNNISLKDDIWKYDVTLNEWVWMAGSQNSNTPPIYGTMGVSSPSNTPGGRNAYAVWKDLTGNPWLYGGSQLLSHTADLWKFDMANLQWTWMGGSDVPNSAGNNTGNFCASDTAFYPGSRSENRACWRDDCGNFWMFGGASLYTGFGFDNDLWVYRPNHKDWTWAGGTLGTNLGGNYGTQGVSSPTNVPGSRNGAPGVYDQNGNLWLFGGKFPGLETTNDLWRFVPDTSCPSIGNCGLVLPFIASDTAVCEKFCVDFTDQSLTNPTAWLWQFPGGSPSTSTLQNPVNICYNNPGSYDVTLITTTAAGTDTLSLINFITVYPTPAIPTITQTGYTLTSTFAANYQWQLNNANIPGATNQSYDVIQSGYYTVLITDENGCTSSANQYVLITGINEIASDLNLMMYPNPSHGNITIEMFDASTGENFSMAIYNILGEIVFSNEEKISGNHFVKTVDVTELSGGIYLVAVKVGDAYVRKAMVVD